MANTKNTTKKTTPRKRSTVNNNKKKCNVCQKNIDIKLGFYSSNSKFHEDGRSPICKNCMTDMVDIHNIDSVIMILQQLDRPFLEDLWKACFDNSDNPFGEYMKQVSSLPQFSGMTHIDGMKASDRRREVKVEKRNVEEEETETSKRVVTPEQMKFWGSNHSKEDVLRLQELYEKMKLSYEIETESHEDLLKKICRVSLKMDKALDEDDHKKFKEYHGTYKAMMSDAKFNPVQRSASDKVGGMNTFGEWFEAVEKDGFIPKFHTDEPQDIVDATINNMMEWTRKLVLGDSNLAVLVEQALTKLNIEGLDEIEDEDDSLVEYVELDEVEEEE